MAHDQNGRRLTKNITKVMNEAGETGYRCTVWFGSSPATNVRNNVYRTKEAAKDGDISDDYKNCSDLLSIGARDWK